MKNFKRMPFAFLFTLIWCILRIGIKDIDVSTKNPIGVILMIAFFLILILEFFKSGDIGITSFGIDLIFSVLTTIIGTISMTLLIYNSRHIYITDILVCLVVLTDAFLSPFNSFRTALRNLAASFGNVKE